MNFIQLPVFSEAEDHRTKLMYVNPEQIFFISKCPVPTNIVDQNKKPIMKDGALITCGGGGGLLVDMLVEDVLKSMKAVTLDLVQEDEDGNSKPIKKNKRGVRKSTSNVGRRPADN